jgi:hypothetical protein
MGTSMGIRKPLWMCRILSPVHESVHDVKKLPQVLRKWHFSRRDDEMKDEISHMFVGRV